MHTQSFSSFQRRRTNGIIPDLRPIQILPGGEPIWSIAAAVQFGSWSVSSVDVNEWPSPMHCSHFTPFGWSLAARRLKSRFHRDQAKFVARLVVVTEGPALTELIQNATNQVCGFA